jgi:predicted nucleic acid-binding protein
MTGNAFVDTNILIYARDTSEPEKQSTAEALLKTIWERRTGRISTQVLNEYYVKVTQKLKPGLTREEAWQDIHDLKSWNPISMDMSLLERGRTFQERFSLSWWDSLILAAADHTACSVVYSEDLSHGQTYFGITVLNPFV